MPSSPWSSLQLQQPAAITALGDTISTGLSTVKTFLQAVRVEAQLTALRFTDPSDLTAAGLNRAVQALVGAAEDAVAELLDDTGAYLLVVPLPKKGLVRLVPDGTADEPGSTFFDLPVPALVEQMSAADRERLRDSTLFDQLADASQVLRGGNAYFVKTVSESLFDSRDSSRPRFSREDYWAYAVFVAGAEDLAAALPLAGFIERLIGDRSRVPATRGVTSVVPQNLRVHQSGRGRTAVVEWDPVSPSRVLASYDDNVVRPVEYVIIRSTDFRVVTCLSVSDLFGTHDLQEGATGQFGAKVVAKKTFDGITARWIDTESLEGDRDYYYLVGFKCRVDGEGDAEPTTLDYDKLVAAGPIRIRAGRARTTQGRPPDWVRVPSFATIFPPVERFLDKVLEQLRSIARASQTVADINDAYVRAIEAEIERYTTLAEEFTRQVEAVTNLLTMPRSVAGIAMKTGTGHGDVGSFFSRLALDFADLSDPNRPGFDAGDEYVTGFVMLAVGPDPVAIAKQLDIFNPLFGSPEQNDLLAGVRSIGDQLDILEAQVAAEEAASQSFNDDMTPRPVGQGDASCDATTESAEPTFDDSMSLR